VSGGASTGSATEGCQKATTYCGGNTREFISRFWGKINCVTDFSVDCLDLLVFMLPSLTQSIEFMII